MRAIYEHKFIPLEQGWLKRVWKRPLRCDWAMRVRVSTQSLVAFPNRRALRQLFSSASQASRGYHGAKVERVWVTLSSM